VEPAFVALPDLREVRAPIEFSWVGETARLVGTVTHRWLQRIAEDGLESWSANRVQALRNRVDRDLACRGVPVVERGQAVDRVLAALAGAITDERGRWKGACGRS
jgi:ATP-dependent helicase/nuclease subunit A